MLSDGHWQETRVCESPEVSQAHELGANSVTWAPAVAPGGLWLPEKGDIPSKRIATGGCDKLVKIWRFDEKQSTWMLEGPPLKRHTDWVRCVAWAPSVGLSADTIASCSQDKSVVIWAQEDSLSWSSKELPLFEAPVWSVSWSLTGNLLGVASGEDKITLWKEQMDGTWANISEVLEDKAVPAMN
mmetsp:Transcript_11654/g.23692  ORF Transcript_11654/g.23692 Transcript_11654/m.23692 type:complete len:185 (+) Transcript_11654:850-1404(+)